METTIRINTDMLNMDILEGIKNMFPHKTVAITIQEEFSNTDTTLMEYPSDDDIKNGKYYIEGDEDATQFILNRPALAEELLRRIKSYEEGKADLITVNVEDLIK